MGRQPEALLPADPGPRYDQGAVTAVLALGGPELPGLLAALGGTGTGDGGALPLPREGAALDPRTVGPLLDRAAGLLASHQSLIVVYPAAARD